MPATDTKRTDLAETLPRWLVACIGKRSGFSRGRSRDRERNRNHEGVQHFLQAVVLMLSGSFCIVVFNHSKKTDLTLLLFLVGGVLGLAGVYYMFKFVREAGKTEKEAGR